MQGFKEPSPGTAIGKALAISVILSVLMMLTGLGFIRLLSGMRMDVSIAIVLVVFAISFIIATVLLDKMSDNLLASFMGGAAAALSITVFIVALVSGAYFLMDKTELPGTDSLLIGFAVCLIAGMVINRLTLKL